MNPENNFQEPAVNQAELKTSDLNTVTPLSKYLAMFLFIILPFIGGWIGYQYAPEKIVVLESESVIKDSPDSDNTNQMPSDTNVAVGTGKILLFQFGCDGPACLILNTIDALTLASEETKIVTSGYLTQYGIIDKDTFFHSDTENRLFIIDLTTAGSEINRVEITQESLGLTDEYQLQSIRSLNNALYILAQKIELTNQEYIVTDSQLIKYDLGDKSAANINLGFVPNSLYSNFIGSDNDYLYLTSSTRDTGDLVVYKLNTLTEKIIDAKSVAGCAEENPESSTPCTNTNSELSKLATYKCGDSILSPVYTQDGSNLIKMENIANGNSTTTSGSFGMCVQ